MHILVCIILLPNQSLLKIRGKKFTCQYVPCIKRAHGSGAIFPLFYIRDHLFSLGYHHEGGDHHWYIIRIVDEKNSSARFDHGQLFIDPSLLDINYIRYNRIIQHPNEFVVLSVGALSQSFTVDVSWSESIDFALLSWIEDGHTRGSIVSNQYVTSHNSSLKTNNMALVRYELIQKYTNLHLNTITTNKSNASTGSPLYL